MAQHQDTITHFSHPGHELVKRHHIGPFLCDMCWEDMSGSSYLCLAGCNFGIHESCATHPHTLSSPAHHAHPLALVQTRHDAATLQLRCDVCYGTCAPGCFLYRCPPCGFDMHPRCARLPAVVRSSRHPAHDLALVVAADGRCAACHGVAGRATSYYRCAACSFDFHVSCAASTDAAEMQAAARDVQAAIVRQRLQTQGANGALEVLSSSWSTVVRREYFF